MDFLPLDLLSPDIVLAIAFVFSVLISLGVGEQRTIKLLLFSFPALFLAHGIVVLFLSAFPDFSLMVQSNQSQWEFALKNNNQESLATTTSKLVLFLFILLLLLIFSPFETRVLNSENSSTAKLVHLLVSLAFGAFFVTTILILLTGVDFFSSPPHVRFFPDFIMSSAVAKMILSFSPFLLGVPAIFIFLSSFIHKDKTPEEETEDE